MKITRNQHQGTFCDFLGFDGITYRAAHIVKVSQHNVTLRYRVRLPLGEVRIVTAYLPKKDYARLTPEQQQ